MTTYCYEKVCCFQGNHIRFNIDLTLVSSDYHYYISKNVNKVTTATAYENYISYTSCS